ncbi:MAG TPA: DUF2950 domain-containing protein [Nitrospirota bacterium]|nr:DUF2950 domain-containing protein [Nitrospirota bacterium]
MDTRQLKSTAHSTRRKALVLALLCSTALLIAGKLLPAAEAPQQHFSSPEEALKSLVAAVKAHDHAALDRIFGPTSKELLSGDSVQDAAEFSEFSKHVAEKTVLTREGDAKVIISVGNENWPFPIPLVKADGQWSFDVEAGRDEILNRRIGEDELTAIMVCRTYVKAQREYVLKDWDGDGIFAYAQKLRSEPGKKDGLFWRHEKGGPVSPLGEFVAQARMSGYKKDKSLFKDQPVPFHGYYFKILTQQGKSVAGGAYSYIINGNMVGGFALVAFPSNWGKSGIMSFIVNQQGKVYQKNLGADTMKLAQDMDTYDPDATWTLVKE